MPKTTPTETLRARLLELADDYAGAAYAARSAEAAKRSQARAQLVAAIDALPSAPAWPCHCDERGIGKPGVTCGDCPRDYGHTPASAPSGEPADTLRQRLQQQCTDWGTYWRASDAHGVDLTHEQALELLRDALGVEVAIAAPLPARHVGESKFESWFSEYRPGSSGDKQRMRDAYAAGMSDPGAAPLLPNGLTESETAATASVAGLAPLQSCEWTNCPTRVGDVCCNDRAAPGASPPAALAVPAGMALVPVEPTPEMLYPDLQTAGPGTQLGDMCAGFGREIWARMLAASQESATTRGGVSRKR